MAHLNGGEGGAHGNTEFDVFEDRSLVFSISFLLRLKKDTPRYYLLTKGLKLNCAADRDVEGATSDLAAGTIDA